MNGSVLVLSHNRLVCKTSKRTYSKTDDQWSSRVGNSPDCTTVHVLAIRRGSCMARVESQAFWILDVNAGYIHCINNQYNRYITFKKFDKYSFINFHSNIHSFINIQLQSVFWILAEFRHNKIVQLPLENCFNVCRQLQRKVRPRKHDVLWEKLCQSADQVAKLFKLGNYRGLRVIKKPSLIREC